MDSDNITEDMITKAAEAMEDAAVELLGRDLGTIHRNEIAERALRAGLAGRTVVEHAVQMSGGGMHVRASGPDIERVYPLKEWVALRTREGNCHRRVVLVVEDWEDLAAGPGGSSAVSGVNSDD